MLISNKIPFGKIFKRAWKTLFILLMYTLLLIYLHDDLNQKYLKVHPSIPAILGTTLAFFMGFITNSSYSRWWEARKLWGRIVNDSRTLARQVIGLVDEPNKVDEEKRQFVLRQVAWCWVLANVLRKKDYSGPMNDFLSVEEKEKLKGHSNVPNGLLLFHQHQLSDFFRNQRLNHYQQMQIDATLSRLCDHMGACERIKNTVFPTQYSFFVHFVLVLFLFVLPLGIVSELHILTVPVVLAIGFIFVMIEGIEINMQSPFEDLDTDTPMYALSRTIEINLKQMLEEKEVPAFWEPKNGVLD